MSELHREQEAPIRAWLSYYIDGGITDAWLNFPTSREELEANLGTVGIPLGSVTDIADAVYETSINDLDRRLPQQPDLDELNHLAVRIEGMEQCEREVFGSVMEANLHCGSLPEIINTADNLDCFDLYPGDFSDQEFGGIMAEMHANEHADIIDRLDISGDPQEKAFAAYVERLESSLDLAKYGHLAQEADNGVLTDSGYLLLPDEPLPEKYTGILDIPSEHLVTARQEVPERKPSLLAALKEAKAASRSADTARSDAPEKKPPSGPEL